MFVRHSTAVYVYEPHFSDGVLRINSLGLRGDEIVSPAVAIIGDSIISASKIERSRTAAGILESAIGRPVASIAVAGWSPQCQLGFVEQHGILGAPAAILVLNRGDMWARHLKGPPVAPRTLRERIASRFQRTRSMVPEIERIIELAGSNIAVVYHLSRREPTVPPALVRITRRRGLPLLVAAHPLSHYLDHVHVGEAGQKLLGTVLKAAHQAAQGTS